MRGARDSRWRVLLLLSFRCGCCVAGLTARDMPKPLQPQFILDVENKELGINAGLQDRVVQVGALPCDSPASPL